MVIFYLNNCAFNYKVLLKTKVSCCLYFLIFFYFSLYSFFFSDLHITYVLACVSIESKSEAKLSPTALLLCILLPRLSRNSTIVLLSAAFN